MAQVLKDEVRDSILESAREEFLEHGFDDSSMRRIAQKSRMTVGNLYRYFKSKDELQLQVTDHVDEIYAQMARDYGEDSSHSAMEQLLDADNPVEKLWILLSKYLDLPEMFGPDLTSVLMQMDLQGRFGLEEAVLDFVGRYYKWFLRFAKECQQDGIIQTPGDLQRLVEFGVELTFYTVSQWCSSGGSFPLRPRVYEKMEDFYVIAPEYRGLWKKEPGTPEEDA